MARQARLVPSATILLVFSCAYAEDAEMGSNIESDLVNPKKEEAVIVAIVALLIGMTIIFEEVKQRIQALSSRSLRPVVEALFGEMTILGFLSACTFVIIRTHWPAHLSERWFGEKTLLVEIFEQVHFTVFFIMLSFVLQVIVLVHESKETELEWKRADLGQSSSEDARMMMRLQKEFVLDRSLEPPFAPSMHQLPADFKFGHYLSLCLGHTMAHIVHVQIHSWAFFLVITFAFYRVMVALKNDFLVLAWVWCGMGWLILLLTVWFQKYLHRVMQAFAAPEEAVPMYGEDKSLLKKETLPQWCRVRFSDISHQPLWHSFIKRHADESRQTSLFWGGSAGPKVHNFVLQTTFVFLGIYVALLIMAFFPKIREEYEEEPLVVALYAVVAVLPIIILQRRSKAVVADAAILNSIGFCRRPQLIADVLRQDKMASAVRAFIVLDKMHHLVESGAAIPASESIRDQNLSLVGEVELRELGKTFDALDPNGDGEISREELKTILCQMGKPLPAEDLHQMVSLLDANEDGNIDKSEFLNWYKANLLGRHDKASIRQRSQALFDLFDHNRNGIITLAEFKTTLDALSVGFTIDEVGLIIRELDEDGDITIGIKEFTELLEKFSPHC